MKLKCLLSAFICVHLWLFSTTIEIKQDGSGDYTIIQEGINASVTDDTIRVYPGTYYENIFIDKSISLVSNYEYSGNEQDIHNTILDGNYQSSVIRLEGEEYCSIYVYICGFVIQHGSGWHRYDHYDKQGGGVRSEYVSLTLKKNTIKNNRAYSGGGLFLIDTYTNLVGNLITENLAFGGGGLIVIRSDISFDAEILNNVYLNFAGKGNDIFRSHNTPNLEVIVDTFTVIEPDFSFLYAINIYGYYQSDDITYNIQHGKIEQIEHDLYVSAGGDDNNSGLTADDPLQNIHYALTLIKADSLHHRTVHVADGLYSPSLNNQYFPLHMKSYVSIIGGSRDNTILDAEDGISHIYAGDIIEGGGFLQRDYSIKKFKLINNYYKPSISFMLNHNVLLENIEISDSETCCYSLIRSHFTHINMDKIYIHDTHGGRACFISGANGYTVNLTNFKIDNNSPSAELEAPLGVGFWIDNNLAYSLQPEYLVNIINAQITNNVNHDMDWPNPESALTVLQWAKVNLINSTISDNESIWGGAVVVNDESELNIYNSILYGDIPREIVLDGSNGHVNTLSVQNSLVEGGEDSILSMGYNNIYWADSNLDEDPLFYGVGDYPFALLEGSPCIDAGTLDLPEGVVMPAFDLAGNPRVCGSSIDMGCYEFPDIAAPINLVVDSATLYWSIPLGNLPNAFTIYLDDELQASVSGNIFNYTFPGLINNQTYVAGVSAIYGDDETAIINIEFVYEAVSVSENISIINTKISNYPNPFNPNTTIKFELAEAGNVDLAIYNIKGQKVTTLIDAYSVEGIFEMVWRGKDDDGKAVSSGQYFIKLKQNGNITASKMMLLK